MGIPNPSRSHRSLIPFSRPLSSSWPSPLSLDDLCCYIFLSFVHLLPTLVSHLCLSSSARPIGHSFWRSVSCYGPHCSVQGSHPYQWGQGVSCGYLIRRWRLLLGLSLPHSPMASPYDLESLLRSLSGLPLVTWRVSLPWFWLAEERVVLDSTIWWSGFPSFVLGHFFLLSMGLGLDIKWAGVPRSFGLTIAPQNPAVRILRRGGGFWRSRAYIMAGWVLFPYGYQGFFVYPWHAPGASTYEAYCHECFLFGDNADRFGIRKVYSMAPLWNGADLEVEGPLGN